MTYAYKCPKCKGEFIQPGISKINRDSLGMPFSICPFCAELMKGL